VTYQPRAEYIEQFLLKVLAHFLNKFSSMPAFKPEIDGLNKFDIINRTVFGIAGVVEALRVYYIGITKRAGFGGLTVESP